MVKGCIRSVSLVFKVTSSRIFAYELIVFLYRVAGLSEIWAATNIRRVVSEYSTAFQISPTLFNRNCARDIERAVVRIPTRVGM